MTDRHFSIPSVQLIATHSKVPDFASTDVKARTRLLVCGVGIARCVQIPLNAVAECLLLLS